MAAARGSGWRRGQPAHLGGVRQPEGRRCGARGVRRGGCTLFRRHDDGYSPPEDCDDQDPGRHPDATDDTYELDGVDQDCDGKDGVFVRVFTWASDYQEWFRGWAPAGDVDADGLPDVVTSSATNGYNGILRRRRGRRADPHQHRRGDGWRARPGGVFSLKGRASCPRRRQSQPRSAPTTSVWAKSSPLNTSCACCVMARP